MARSINITKLEIIQTATRLFFSQGFSKTTASLLSKEVGISTGNLTFYFPTKEHILQVLVEMMCEFQWKIMEEHTDEGKSSLLSYCLELATMVAISEENEQMRDFYLSSYTLPMTLEIIRENDLQKTKQVFGEYCKDWKEDQFVEAETIVSGIEYATLMTTKHSAQIDKRVEGALRAIMLFYGVPEEIRDKKIAKILAMDYKTIGKRMLESFKTFAEETTENAIEEKINSIRNKNK
ncbi:MAG: TetR/AcrR family transcriptional regulator [Clostridiales bacterium]|nr:TetR/AcrR family transcriptional regulator [Clostridiales bacterium]